VQDTVDDTLLCLRGLRHAGFRPTYERVATAAEFEAALQRQGWDLIVSEYRLPNFTALAALALCRTNGWDIPFIIVSDVLDADSAVAAMKAGADDCVSKAAPGRFVSAVEEALVRAERRTEQRRIEAGLRESELLFRKIFEEGPLGVVLGDLDGRIILANARACHMLGYDHPDQLVGLSMRDVYHVEGLDDALRNMRLLIYGQAEVVRIERPFVRRDKSILWGHMTATVMRDKDGGPMCLLGMVEDVSAWHRTQVELQEAEERYRAIFEQAGDAIVLLDPQTGRVVACNEQTSHNLGYTHEELMKLRVMDVEVDESEAETLQHLRNISERGHDSFSTRHRRKDGGIRDVWVNARTVTLRGKQTVLAVLRDITDLKRKENELRAAVTRLEDLDKARSEFVSNVSHELKTPVAAMMHAMRNLLRGAAGPLPEQVTRYLKVVDGQCHRLLNSIQDILDLREMEAGTLQLVKVKVPLSRVTARRAEILSGEAVDKFVELAVQVDKKAGFVECDLWKIERVIHNLLDNALKFTPSGGQVNVRVFRQEDAQPSVIISVEDNGLGIPATAFPHVTERYFRAGNHPVGSGLGLSISAEIVKLHNGELQIQSPPPGKKNGTLVSVRLPASEPPTVLVIVRDNSLRSTICGLLEEYGFWALAVGEIEKGRAIIENKGVDCVVACTSVAPSLVVRLQSVQGALGRALLAVDAEQTEPSARQVLSSFGVPVIKPPLRAERLVDAIETVLSSCRLQSVAFVPGEEQL